MKRCQHVLCLFVLLDLIWWANDDLIWTIKSLSGKWNHVRSTKIWSELQLSGNEEHLDRKTGFIVWADVGIPCGSIPEQAKEEHVRIPDAIWCMWHGQILNDVIILSLAHVSSSHLSPYPWRGSWFMLQSEDEAPDKTGRGDTSAVCSFGIKLQSARAVCRRQVNWAPPPWDLIA